MATVYKDLTNWDKHVTVVAGTPLVVPVMDQGYAGKLGVYAIPGASGTINVEWTMASAEQRETDAANVVWTAWTPGAAAAPAQEALPFPMTAVRLTAATANAKVLLFQ